MDKDNGNNRNNEDDEVFTYLGLKIKVSGFYAKDDSCLPEPIRGRTISDVAQGTVKSEELISCLPFEADFFCYEVLDKKNPPGKKCEVLISDKLDSKMNKSLYSVIYLALKEKGYYNR